ncbi:MAG: hypothetical protein AMS26_10065 [Bacteroides sp. SM23_62]|nr:MAG: hypothetical protein AMS26_10065 [Bacteroides sp. SM23_62]
MRKIIPILSVFMVFYTGCENTVDIRDQNLSITFDRLMHSSVRTTFQGDDPAAGFNPSEYLVTRHGMIQDFTLSTFLEEPVSDDLGTGKRYKISGIYHEGNVKVEKNIIIRSYGAFPDFFLFNTSYRNIGEQNITIMAWITNHYPVRRKDPVGGEGPDFWSFHGSSSAQRADWILPLVPGFYKENYMGMNNSDYGGGIPVADIWREDFGLGVGLAEIKPRLVSLPVEYGEYSHYASLQVRKDFEEPVHFQAGDTLFSYQTFLTCHRGDVYGTLKKFSALMRAGGLRFVEPEPAAFEPIWCAWGYERNFTVEEIIGTLPKVKELGIKWVVIDDGYQQAIGDWNVNPERFRGGSKDMRNLVDRIHALGLKAKLWYAPLAVDPGSNLLKENPGIILLNKNLTPQYITWWDSYLMSPTSEETQRHTEETIRMFMGDWDFDGLKLDGQHLNAVPPDHSQGHGLAYPEQAPEKLADFFYDLYDLSRNIKPKAVVQQCPCGTCMSFYNMLTTNQTVASDPLSSWQIRSKGKVYKALIEDIAYYGDHVELSDGGNDFASTIGIGAVPGTKFTWPKDNPTASSSYLLTTEKESAYKKWFFLYNSMMLSEGEYLGDLYDIGFDIPEAHVIRKDSALYYAFFADDWKGDVRFRGLAPGVIYQVYDYVNDQDLGTITGDENWMELSFQKYKLLKLSLK